MKQNTMVERGDRIVVGVSGGADSVCLLHVMHELTHEYGIQLLVVHINHGIRGREAKLDADYVKELSDKLGIEYLCFNIDVRDMAEKEGLSEEEAGRKARYDAFLEVCKSHKCNKIAIAHNRNDNAETVLFNLFRGSGIKGLTGIDPVRQISTDFGTVTLIRPLHDVERGEIEDFLSKQSIEYRTDQTNLTDDYSRNKIRNQILPYAEREINRNAVTHIAAAANQLKEAEEFIENFVDKRYLSIVEENNHFFYFRVKKIQKEDIIIQKGIIRKILSNLAGKLKDIEAKHINQVIALYDKQVGKLVHLPYDMVAQKDYEGIKIFINQPNTDELLSSEQFEPMLLPIPGRIYLPEIRKYLITSVIPIEKNEPIPKNTCTKWFDYDKIENAVVIRNRNEGDYIQINRFGGKKKLKDYFIDQKIPKDDRSKYLLIADGSHIIWVIGDKDRISEKYKVEETTNKILLMKLIDLEEMKDDR
ncbi:MAG TPA: tRNA lysidine(34) synthetase TilS [Mobilitalea sp.]|nr:tRNA lysidine(34) synthetase TilS [Mobilitalea sp.]